MWAELGTCPGMSGTAWIAGGAVGGGGALMPASLLVLIGPRPAPARADDR